MSKTYFHWFISLIGAFILLSGCGGGGGGGGTPSGGVTTPTPTPVPQVVSTISGTVSDGPIRNARVFLDLNYDGVFTIGEPFDITDENGNFEISYVLENDTEYLLIAEGSNTLGTADPADNGDLGNLDFVMYSSVKTVQSEDTKNTPVVKTYGQNMNPSTFQKYLKDLDQELLGGLDTENTKVSDLLNSTTTDTRQLFRQNIVNTPGDSTLKSTFTSKLAEVAELIESKEEEKQSDSTKEELNLESTNSFVFSEASTTQLTKQLAFSDKTTPNKVGDLIVTSTLRQVSTSSSYKVFVTPYRSIMDIPDYAKIRDQGLTVLLGADVVVKDSSGKRVLGVQDSHIVNSILASLNFESLDSLNFQALNEANVSYLSYDGSNWSEITTSLSIDFNQILGLNNHLRIAPLVLARKNFLQAPKEISVAGYTDLANPVIIAHGHWVNPDPLSPLDPIPLRFTNGSVFKNLEETSSVHLDISPLSGSTVSFTIPQDFAIDELVVISRDVAGVDTAGRVSIKLGIENDALSQSGSPSFVLIEDASLKSLLLAGSGLESYTGLDSLIETRIPHEIMRVFFEKSPTVSESISANQMILANAGNYLSGTSSFSSQGISTLDWEKTLDNGTKSTYSFTVDESTKSCTLKETNRDSGSALVYSRDITWLFFGTKVEKTVVLSHSSGDRKGSSNTHTVTFDRNGGNTLIAVFQDRRREILISSGGFKSDLQGFYKGSAIFDRTSDFDVDEILSAKYEQSLTQSATFNDELVGGVQKLSGFLEMDNGALRFKADFQVHLDSYGSIAGKVSLRGNNLYARGFDQAFYNNNLLEDAVFTVAALPQKQSASLPTGIEGQWSGSFSDSCAGDGQMILQISGSSQSWSGQSSDSSRFYGTNIVVSDQDVFLYDETRIWSRGTFESTGPTISGNWNDGVCNGSYQISPNP